MDVTSYLLGKKAGGGSAPVLQDKEVEITENGETTITADSGYDGLSSVEVTTAIPQPSGKITITQNGTDIDVSSYATADVSVPSTDYVVSNMYNFNFTFYTGTDLSNDIKHINISTACRTLTSTFQNCTNLINIDGIGNWDVSNITNFTNMFRNCSSLTRIDLSNWQPDATKMENYSSMSNMFDGCTSLTFLDIRTFDMQQKISAYSNTFKDIPVNCEIIVANDTQKQTVLSTRSDLTNVKTVAEYEGS